MVKNCNFINDACIFEYNLVTFFLTLFLSQIIFERWNLNTKLGENVCVEFDHMSTHGCKAEYKVNISASYLFWKLRMYPAPSCYFLTSWNNSMPYIIIFSFYLLRKVSGLDSIVLKVCFLYIYISFPSPYSLEIHLIGILGVNVLTQRVLKSFQLYQLFTLLMYLFG